MFDSTKQVVATFILERNSIKYRIEIERVLQPTPGRFSASAYMLDTDQNGQERWTLYDLRPVDEEDPKAALAAAKEGLIGGGTTVSRW